MRFAFRDFVVDTERYVIERGAQPVHVQRQVFDVLAYLLEHRDRVVSKEELLDEVWGDRFVSESALTSRIKSARQAVGDDGAAQACIKTAHGRGYRWIAEVRVEPAVVDTGTQAVVRTPQPIPPPMPLTSLVGREDEIAAVLDGVGHRRLTTAVGPPGVGKSRLAVEVARSLVATGHEVAFADLRPADDAHTVDVVRRAVGAVPGSPRERRTTTDGGDELDELVELLQARRLVLVLDNCEHVHGTIERLSFHLLTRCSELAVIATSRRRLGVVGELVVPVDPLSVPSRETSTWDDLTTTQAGRLFVERSLDAGARWSGSATEARQIAHVCRCVDGLPLAIELAAARTRWLALPDLVRHLDREVGLDHRDPLQAALRMSRGLLDPDERLAFDALSVFAGSFTIDAALHVIQAVAPTSDALAVFGQLVDHSLVSVDEGELRRYRLLETVQRFADGCRQVSDEPDVPLRAHAEFYLSFVEARWPSGRIVFGTSWDALGAEMTEVLAATRNMTRIDTSVGRRLVGAVGWYWSIGGYAEQCEELAELLAGSDQSARHVEAADPPDVEAAFLFARTVARVLIGRDPVDVATRAHALALEAGSWSIAAWSLAHMVAPDMMWADLATVESRWDEVVELFRRGDDPLGEAWAMVFVLGWAEACAGLRLRATRTYEAAAGLFERHGDHHGRARALLEIVELNSWSGDDLVTARAAFERITAVEGASMDFRMKYLWIGGLLASAEHDWPTAVQWHTRAVELAERSVPGSILANTFRTLLGWTMRSAGRIDDAARQFGRALTFLPRGRMSHRWSSHATWTIESVAGLLSEVGVAEPAARLMAAADRARRELDSPMPYWDRPRYEPDLRRLRDQLGEAGFEAAWVAGLDLELLQALRLAEEQLCGLGGEQS